MKGKEQAEKKWWQQWKRRINKELAKIAGRKTK